MLKIDTINEAVRIGQLDLQAFGEEQSIVVKRDIETAGTRFLLNKLFEGKSPELAYTETKKPYLKNDHTRISISHSYDKLVIIANTKEETGVDIELIREKVKNIQHKFLCKSELTFANGDLEKLTTLWAAKEAIYKIYGVKELDFKKNILIENYTETENNFFGKIDLPKFKRRFLLTRQKLENYILVYILNEV